MKKLNYFNSIIFAKVITLFVCAMVVPSVGYACDFNDEDGLDVALVLSGGGAKASTQIGALQVLEEMEVPIHCIIGTSMGAVVGAFYSAGYSADEIGDIFTENNWGRLFAGIVQRNEKSYVEKNREADYLSGNIAGISEQGAQLLGGINSMQRLKGLYRHLLRDVPIDAHFDQLNIPFRAVATDLQSGEAKVFERGDLVESILASMAVPGIFAPRKINDRLYIDGGVSSTLPIRTAKAMGADIIIALDVSEEPPKPNANISVTQTFDQLVNVIIWQNLQQDLSFLQQGDVHWKPNTVGIKTASYERSAKGIEAGRQYALTQPHQVLQSIINRAAPRNARPLKTIKVDQKPASNKILIRNEGIIKENIIKSRGNIDNVDWLDVEKSKKFRNELMAFGGFEEVDIGKKSNGDIELNLKKDRLGRNLLQLGFNTSSDFKGDSDFSFLARITRKPLSEYGGDFSLSGEFGTNIALNASIYQPIGNDGRFFFQPELYARWDRESLTIGDERIGDFLVRKLGVQLGLGRELGTWGLVAVETEINRIKADDIVTTIENFTSSSSSRIGVGLVFESDTLNRTDWPTSGNLLSLKIARSFDLDATSINTDRYDASFISAFNIANNYGVLFHAQYGEIEHESNAVIVGVDFYQLGGFRQLGQFRNGSIPVTKFGYASIETFKRLSEDGKIFSIPAYVGVIGEVARIAPSDFFNIGQEKDNTITGTLYFGLDTAIGPFFIGASYGDQDFLEVFFKLGKTF
ncbi:patatin-like phospholipase family protein [Pelagibaculum spongiae]|uniref:PNPLA domain-containing protein n=1 Tax=Pelagibaculum spongiae TaxID=2080658 RepID=A0A2V1GTA9_9GAMM|nr:patatin-like phospholipase family protein [Pelagibaculum spongiae]PVZ68838.1 hypothetical protein DC094_11320 [Pelagibaculum spongiae]